MQAFNGRAAAPAACLACLTLISAPAGAAEDLPAPLLPEITVKDTATTAGRYALPGTEESVSRETLHDTVNLMNTEDALRYLPDLLARKRHIGDTQAPITTRTSGVGASARSLIYADGILLSPLIANNNNIGGPRYGMVAPGEIERVDVLYGPYAAAYPGNAIGAVVNIVTRMPQGFEAGAQVQHSNQDFSQYGTRGDYPAGQYSALVGNRNGGLSWWLSANHLDAHSQPLAYVTAARPAAPSAAGTAVSGAYADINRTGAPIAVIGAGGFEHQVADNLKLKLAYDWSERGRVAYTAGWFQQDDDATAQSYLRDGAGRTLYAGSFNIGGYNYVVPASAFSANVYRFDEGHFMQSLSARSTGGALDWEAAFSRYDYVQSEKRVPLAALPAATGGGAGTVESMKGTGWTTLDLKAAWHAAPAQDLSFGVHGDRYVLVDPKYNTSDWSGGATDVTGTLATDARGKTRTAAAWVQDAWRFAPEWTLTLGGRQEWWRAYDGYNYSAAPALVVRQPGLDASAFSPKAALAWAPGTHWLATLAVGGAYRFPTVAELYQAVTTGATLSVPNPNLRPEHAVSGEAALERSGDAGRLRLSLFSEDVSDALVSQSAPLVAGSTTLYNYVQNVDRTRARGAEVVGQARDFGVRGLELNGSVTYVDARIRADAAFPAAVGKRLPQVPDWRATVVATWKPDEHWSTSLGARYSARVYATADNSDIYSHTWQGFDGYFVMDARVAYRFDRRFSAALGVDNLNDRKYFLFHPFPQRTVMAEFNVDY